MSNVEQNFKIGDKVVWFDKEYAGKFHKETVGLVMSITGIDYIDEARAYLILVDNKVEAFDYRFELYKEKEM